MTCHCLQLSLVRLTVASVTGDLEMTYFNGAGETGTKLEPNWDDWEALDKRPHKVVWQQAGLANTELLTLPENKSTFRLVLN